MGRQDMSWCRRVSMALVAALVSIGTAACGVPQDATTRPIDPTRVPYDLLDTDPAHAPGPTPNGRDPVVPQVFFLVEETFRPVPRPPDPGVVGVEPVTAEVLARLSAGPTEQERAEGMSSALGPGVGLTLLEVTDRVARISLEPSDQPPPADRAPLAVGQLVFTVTSVDGVDRVQLLRDGRTIEVPLPGGARTVEPVGASDYLSLLTTPTP